MNSNVTLIYLTIMMTPIIITLLCIYDWRQYIRVCITCGCEYHINDTDRSGGYCCQEHAGITKEEYEKMLIKKEFKEKINK